MAIAAPVAAVETEARAARTKSSVKTSEIARNAASWPSRCAAEDQRAHEHARRDPDAPT